MGTERIAGYDEIEVRVLLGPRLPLQRSGDDEGRRGARRCAGVEERLAGQEGRFVFMSKRAFGGSSFRSAFAGY